ncbi:FliM/FliN family flagellar motor switch protein [Marinivivus vitaminiproducens]|uniref:FliM/FliN family flagellar motor switch protein n=1 Tax=Marinivivus vitaminiproducens TaxID=3035935 RepID=UPI0027A8A3CB|nr:FliM/FliN family flagellar motor switch protein [Geminicoccaceae bacterium SCSIO 64248]
MNLQRSLRPLGIDDLEVEPADPAVLAAADMAERLPPDGVALAFRLTPSDEGGLLVLDRCLTAGVLQRLLGAVRIRPWSGPAAALSPIDCAVLGRALRLMLHGLLADFGGGAPGDAVAGDGPESDLRYALAGCAHPRLRLSPFHLRLGSHAAGRLILVLPAAEPEDRASTAAAAAIPSRPDESSRPAVVLDAVLEHGRIRLAEIAAWRVGTVIPLPAPGGQTLALVSGSGDAAAPADRLGLGTLGTLNGRRALRLSSVLSSAIAHLAAESPR